MSWFAGLSADAGVLWGTVLVRRCEGEFHSSSVSSSDSCNLSISSVALRIVIVARSVYIVRVVVIELGKTRTQ